MTVTWGSGPDGIRSAVDELAEQLGRSVVVNDPLVRQMYASRHFDDEDPVRLRAMLQHDAGSGAVAHVLEQGVTRWSAPGRVPGSAELDMLPRLCAPLRAHGEFLGTLMVIDADHSLTETEIGVIEEVAAVVAARLSAQLIAADADRERREEAVRALSGSPGDRERAADSLRGEAFLDRAPLVTTLVEVHSRLHTDALLELSLRTAQAAVESATRIRGAGAVRGHRAEFVQQWTAEPTPELLRAEAGRIGATLRRVLGPESSVLVGVGAPVEALGAVHHSHRQATVALRAARRLPRFDGTALWGELGEYAPLLCLVDVPAGSRGERALRALDAHEGGARLRHTLRVYLDEAGNAPRAARALNLHRTSLHYRLDQIAGITGLDLMSGSDRLALHLQLCLEDLSDAGA